jgi:GNAT superfamily N-acetyltransferase
MLKDVKIVEEPVTVLPEYGRIPISFEVKSVFDLVLIRGGLGGFRLRERAVKPPWVKDYDVYKDQGPVRWAKRWDISNWVVISAFLDGSRIGGCVIAFDTPGVDMLEGRRDIAVLWDLRVVPEYRRQGLGGRLVEAAITWARERRCCMLKIETQNINVPACHLYAKHGFVLGAINRHAYRELPDELELIWCKEL